MNDLYAISMQKTYLGKSANWYLQRAKVSEMQAGNYEITSRNAPGAILRKSDDGNLLIEWPSDKQIVLETGIRAYETLNRLHFACEEKEMKRAEFDGYL